MKWIAAVMVIALAGSARADGAPRVSAASDAALEDVDWGDHFETGKTLLGSVETYRRGYVAGAADSARFFEKADNRTTICIPKDANPGQLVDALNKFIAHQPEDRDMPAALLVLLAMRQAWPCSETK